MLHKEIILNLQNIAKGLSVLIVDDDEQLADSFKTLAAHIFRTISVVYSAKSALEAYEKHTFDIIYTDINMPYMNGVELIRIIKGQNPSQAIIVMSGSDDSENLLNLIKLKVSNFILKPFEFEEFLTVTSDQIATLNQMRYMKDQEQRLSRQLHDATQENKLKEDMLIQQSKLAQTGEMISMIAHQWRQPLSSITAQTAAMKMRMELGTYEDLNDETFTNDLYDCFDRIEQSALFLSNTINNFRNFYRPDNELSTFNIKDILTNILSMLMLEEHNISVYYTDDVTQEYCLYGHEGELQQVLMSLFNNARDALLANAIRSPVIKVILERTDSDLKIAIIDNAGGIPEEIIDHIFLPYFSTKDKKNGTGLGLHMAKTIIHDHMQGSINAFNSIEDGGACFEIVLPLLGEVPCTA